MVCRRPGRARNGRDAARPRTMKIILCPATRLAALMPTRLAFTALRPVATMFIACMAVTSGAFAASVPLIPFTRPTAASCATFRSTQLFATNVVTGAVAMCGSGPRRFPARRAAVRAAALTSGNRFQGRRHGGGKILGHHGGPHGARRASWAIDPSEGRRQILWEKLPT